MAELSVAYPIFFVVLIILIIRHGWFDHTRATIPIRKSYARFLSVAALSGFLAAPGLANTYPWLDTDAGTADNLMTRHSAPDGYQRVSLASGSFGEFLRHLPLKPGGTPLRRYDGSKILWSVYAGAIIDLDLGRRDLQQCADTLIRLYSEYRYAHGEAVRLSFNFTSGDAYAYSDYLRGLRPVVSAQKVSWRNDKAVSSDRVSFRRWLDTIFLYAGTASLARDLPKVDLADAQVGDLFIAPGFPGHTVMIADMAADVSGRRKILLIEGFTPAQDAHVLRNLMPFSQGDWYDLEDGEDLVTPVWRFTPNQLHRMD